MYHRLLNLYGVITKIFDVTDVVYNYSFEEFGSFILYRLVPSGLDYLI